MLRNRSAVLFLAVCLLSSILSVEALAARRSTASDTDEVAGTSLRAPLTRERLYFVMPDRFANGDPSNDNGGLTGGPLVTGLQPTHKGFYHGGDLKGLTQRLDYIRRLGTTAIWFTPMFKNRPVQGLGSEFVSAGYHGYWITDFTQVDPHLGTNAELTTFINEAHERGMKVFFDIITNHTADVIAFAEDQYDYRSKAAYPYKDADGNVFDDRDYAGTGFFPPLDPNVSFPYTPVFPTAEDATVKVPAWLNDPTMYHNRGNTTFSGESNEYGDFFGLDDLFTERPEVVDGMTDIFKYWIDEFGVDGFRIDTAKHVNIEFWQEFLPETLENAASAGQPDFYMFGEVFDPDPGYLSTFTTEALFPSVLDFGFQARAQAFAASSAPTDQLRDFFVMDDLYTDHDSNVYNLPTFLGNHDMGRIGKFITDANDGASDTELFARDRLAHELMYLSRGNPVIYYGDEQGFTGDGGDQDAREDMFASQVATYNDNTLIATARTTADENYDRSHPLFQAISRLAAVTERNPALRDGAQHHRYSSSDAGVYAFSRIDWDRQLEYVVALNNSEQVQTVDVPTYSPSTGFIGIYPNRLAPVISGTDGTLNVTVPPLSAMVYQAKQRLPRSPEAPALEIASPNEESEVRDRFEIRADAETDGFYQVSFAVRVGDESEWRTIGTDDNSPYRVFFDTAGLEVGTTLEFRVVLLDNAGHTSTATATAEVAPPRVPLEEAVIHYHRPAGDFGDWGLHLWGDAIAEGVGTDWCAPRAPSSFDDFGAVFEIPLRDDTKSVNFIVHTPCGDDIPTTREPGGDRGFVPSEHPEIWLIQGNPTVYFERPPT
jgi:alpha-amylase